MSSSDDSQKGHRCHICSVVVSTGKGRLQGHIRSKEHQSRAHSLGIYCNECPSRNFLSENTFNNHILTCHDTADDQAQASNNPKSYHCHICDVSILKQVGLHACSEEHRSLSHSLGIHCNNCPSRQFLNRQSFDKHVLKHGIKNAAGKPLSDEGRRLSGLHSAVVVPGLCCFPCDRQFQQASGLEEHQDKPEHIQRCITLGLYCFVCGKTLESQGALWEHTVKEHCTTTAAAEPPAEQLDSEHSDLEQSETESGSEPELESDQSRSEPAPEPPTPTTVPPTPPTPASAAPNYGGKAGFLCQICDVKIPFGMRVSEHTYSTSHQLRSQEQGIVCACGRTTKNFLSAKSFASHYCPKKTAEFRCCDCAQDFSSMELLQAHLTLHDKARNREPPREKDKLCCEPCGISFTSKKEFQKHLLQKAHKTFKCLGSTKCSKRFVTLAAVVMHLESGACVSTLNKKAIDALVAAHDTTRAITIEGAADISSVTMTTATPNLTPATGLPDEAAGPQSPAPAAFEVFDDEDENAGSEDDDEEGGAVIFTPPPTPPRRTNSISSESLASGLFTPASTTTGTTDATATRAPGYSWACHVCAKEFSSPLRLGMHLTSPVHDTPIYRCPSELLVELAGNEPGKPPTVVKPDRTFKTLSGLLQHMEAGACTGGKTLLETAARFVEDKLASLGLAGVHVRMLR